jgi:hypothetical protein
MPGERAIRKKPAKSSPAITPDDLVRHTEEQLALTKELIELARELCITASELRKFAQRR